MAVICISRGTKSGGQALAECLAARLGYPVLGREVVQEAAVQMGVSERTLQEKMSDRPTVWGRFSSLRRMYVTAVQAALAERAVTGRLVYHGLAGGLLLKGLPSLLCVRLIAPMPIRVRAAMEESGTDASSAERYIRELDEARARWVRVMYGEDIMDPALYDLVVNLDAIPVEGACALVARAADAPELTLTQAVRDRLQDFLVSCRVRLTLATDPDLRPLDLDAEARGGRVSITGRVPLRAGGRTDELIHRLARGVPGVQDVRLNVEWFDPYP
jgi:cytidylate kinase